jgi:hypothetical protein
LIIYRNNEPKPTEVHVTTEEPLHIHQIDLANAHILKKSLASSGSVSLMDSFGNTTVLEEWLKHVKTSRA